LIYIALVLTVFGIGLSSILTASDSTQVWVSMRECYGLTALFLLLASMIAGPLSFVIPRLPLKAHLILGRRAIGIAAFVLATLHIICYLGPTIRSNWRALYFPGAAWVTGLLLGVPVFSIMAVLALTSRDDAVRRLGPKRWKRWHMSVYLLLPAALVHAALLGADFGLNRGPDVTAEPDSGSLIAALLVSAMWLILFVLRKKRVRWLV
jgi:sulfoxide reductase heme-binding subunit YedZ